MQSLKPGARRSNVLFFQLFAGCEMSNKIIPGLPLATVALRNTGHGPFSPAQHHGKQEQEQEQQQEQGAVRCGSTHIRMY